MDILDFIFPKFCVNCKKLGSYLCENCFTYLSFDAKSFCLVCGNPSFNGLTHPVCLGKYTIDGAFSGLNYNQTVKRLVHRFKYDPYIFDLRGFLAEFMFESIIQIETFNRILQQDPFSVLVPIPLYGAKFRRRGYNQAEVLARELAPRLNLSMLDPLQRIKNTHSQVGLKEKFRKENIAGAFCVKENFSKDLKGKTIFLVDDVLTTGATLLEGANVLKRAGAKTVFGLTLARD